MTKKDLAKKNLAKSAMPKRSGGNENTITTRVVAYRKAPGLPVQLGVSPEILDLSKVEDETVMLQWELATDGYAFPTDGSAIVFTSPGSQKVFSASKVDRKGQLAVVTAKNVDGLAYAYTVSVVDKSTGLTSVLDPVVQNRLR